MKQYLHSLIHLQGMGLIQAQGQLILTDMQKTNLSHYKQTVSLSHTHTKQQHVCSQTKLINCSVLTWNLVNSSALSSSLANMRRTTCCGSSVKDPRFRTSLPCSSTNSKTCNKSVTDVKYNISLWKHTKIDIPIAVTIKISLFFDMMPCNLVDRYQCLRETHCLHLQGRRGNKVA